MPEILWAPWRLSYVEKPSTGVSGASDIFLDLPAENEDRKNLILYRGKLAFVIMNAYPYTTGHLLVAPFRQVADFVGLTDDELLEINRLVAKCVAWCSTAFNPDGFNVGVNLGRASGAGIPQHIHWHVVPRWNGDTNFMTTVGEVRVMPQSLQDGYERLSKVIANDH
jgi:ATP adenylyltransferase